MLPDETIAAAIRDMAHQRGWEKSFCPSEVARGLAEDWRELMPHIRRVASDTDGIRATQKGVLVDPVAARGPIRLGLA